jgi:hypothetical protein
MSKIAFVSGYYFINGKTKMDDDVRFMYESLYHSAKKYFLTNHETDFIFITNGDDKIDGVTNIRIDNHFEGYHEMLLMKILCVDYLTEEYDYIFVSDGDQIFVDYVYDDILEHPFNAVKHFFNAKSTGIIRELSQFVKISGNTDDITWCTGNFFGGKSDTFNFLLEKTKQYDSHYQQYYDPLNGYYARYPDEVLLMKILIEEKIGYNELSSNDVLEMSENKFYLGDFINDENLYPNFNNVKLLHNTKKNINLLRKVIKYYK